MQLARQVLTLLLLHFQNALRQATLFVVRLSQSPIPDLRHALQSHHLPDAERRQSQPQKQRHRNRPAQTRLQQRNLFRGLVKLSTQVLFIDPQHLIERRQNASTERIQLLTQDVVALIVQPPLVPRVSALNHFAIFSNLIGDPSQRLLLPRQWSLPQQRHRRVHIAPRALQLPPSGIHAAALTIE